MLNATCLVATLHSRLHRWVTLINEYYTGSIIVQDIYYVYLVRVSPTRIKFGLSRSRDTLDKRLRAYRTLVPEAYFIKVYECHDNKYVEELLKRRFDRLRVQHVSGGYSEVIEVRDGIDDATVTGIVSPLIKRANSGMAATTNLTVPTPRAIQLDGSTDKINLVY